MFKHINVSKLFVMDKQCVCVCMCQVWQWIRHQTRLEDDSRVVSRQLVMDLTQELMADLGPFCHSVG